jgi:hypothetical protein
MLGSNAIKTRFRQVSRAGPAGPKHLPREGRSALAGFKAPLHLVDHVDPTFAPDQAIAAMAAAQRFQRIADFHDCHSFGAQPRGSRRFKNLRGT